MRNFVLRSFFILSFLLTTNACAMSDNKNIEKNSINFSELKTATQIQRELQKFYPKGTDLNKIILDLKLNEKSRINDEASGQIILYHLFDGSKNIHGYNYWKVSIRINLKNQIEQISVDDSDYQGS